MPFRLQIKNLLTQEMRHESYPAATLLIGRSKICDLVLADSKLSRQHCSLEIKSATSFDLVDLKSANGTFVDGQKTERKALSARGVFRIGDHEICVLEFEMPKVIDSEDLTPIASEITLKPEPSTSEPQKEPSKRASPQPLPQTQAHVPTPSQTQSSDASDEVSLKTPVFIKHAKPKVLFQTKDWLQVSLLWNEKLVDVKCFDRGDTVSIGEDESNDFVLSMHSIPRTFHFMKVVPTGVELVLHPAMKGLVETKDGTKDLDDLRAQSRQTPLGLAVHIPFSDRCLIEMGPFNFYIQTQKLSLTKPLTAPLVRDPFFASILTASATFFVIFWMGLQSLESMPTEEVAKVDENIVTLAPPNASMSPVPIPPPPPPPKESKTGETRSVKTQLSGTEGEGAKAAGQEGKSGRTTGTVNTRARAVGMITNSDKPLRSVPKGAFGQESDASLARKGLRPDEGVGSGKPKPRGTGSQAPSKELKPQVKVEDMGISGVLTSKNGGGGKANAGGALSGSGLGGELEGSIEGLERGADLDAKGSGGRGAKGLGLGGGGSSIEVGGLSTKGQGGGKSGFGLGSSGKKGDAEVSYTAEDVEVRDGLTREEIERVVRAHADAIQICYEQALSAGSSVNGRLKVGWFVNREGRVENVKLESGPANATSLFNCIASELRGWQFPKPRGGSGAQVSWPWVFRKG